MSRIRRLFAGLRFRLLLLVILASAPLVALTLRTAWEDRQRQITAFKNRAQRLAGIAAREERKLLEGTQNLLLNIAEADAVREGRHRVIQKLVENLQVTYPEYLNLGVLNTNGEVLASTAPVPQSPAGQPFFQQALRRGTFTIGRIDRNQGASIDFGQPLFDGLGNISAVIFATADVQLLGHRDSEIPSQVARGATLTQIDTNGLILARFPKPDSWIGRYYPDPDIVASAFSSPDRIIEALGPKGREYVYAFSVTPSRLVHGPVATILSTPKTTLFAQTDRVLRRNLGYLGLACSLALALGYAGSSMLVVRPIKALVLSSARLARGDLRSRTGLRHGHDELGQLALTFDLMAQSLEQRELERQKAHQKLQLLSHRLVEVQESERRQIARELHDEIGQTLTIAEMNLQAALRSPGGSGLETRLEESIQAVEKVLEQVHDLSLNLRPSMLDDIGLEPTLRWYLHRQADLAGLHAEFRPVPLTSRLPPIVETECFRIAQEALTNVVRHAKAKSVLLELALRNEHLHLFVRDDGVGFDVRTVREKAIQGSSLGVLSMEERAALTGGGLNVISISGQGTEVHAWFPLKYDKTDPLLIEDE